MTEATLGEAQIPIRAKLDKLDKDLDSVKSKVGEAGRKAAAAFGAGVQGLGTAALTAAGTAIAAVAGIGVAIAKMTVDAAPLEGVRDAFAGLAESAGVGGDEMLAALQRGSAGMVSQRDLMLSFNKAAGLVSTDFATQLPDAMQYLGKISAATGQDMGYMLDSLVVGVGRLSPMILDNLQIQASLEEATSRASEMFGLEAEELDKTQIQAGMMNVVLEKLAANTAAMPDVTDTAAAKMAQMKARIQDTKDQIGTAFLPVLSTLLDKFGELADRYLPPIISALETGGEMMSEFFDAVGEGVDPLTAAEEVLKKFLPPELSDTISEVADGIRDAIAWVQELIDTVQPYIEMAMEWISENIELKDVLIALGIAVAAVVIPAVWGVLSPILLVIAAAAVLTLLIAGVRKAWESDFLGIRTAVENALGTIKAWWAEHGDEVMAKAKEIWETVKEKVSTAFETIKEIIETAIANIKEWWAEHGDEIMAKAQEIWDAVVATFEWFKEQINKLFEAFRSAFEGDWRGFGEKLREIWDEAWEKLKGIGEDAWDAIKRFFTETDWGEIGRKILEGIASGISSGLSIIRDAATSAANAALEAAKGFLGIDSPSRVFAQQVGRPSVEGWAQGLEERTALERAAWKLGQTSLSAVDRSQSTSFGPIHITAGAQPEEVAYSLESLRVMLGAT